MRKLVFLFVIISSVTCYNCSSNQNLKTIQFVPLSEKDFNYPADTSFIPPTGKGWDARKKWFDSCIGMSFAANAFFMRTKDTFILGAIVNRKTMKVVKNFN